jgi:hypothetical protein
MLSFICFVFASSLLSLPLLSSAAPIQHRRSQASKFNRRTSYTLEDNYSGPSFFDSFNFFSSKDPTNGYVAYQTKEDAISKGLATVDSNGTIVIAVDSTTTLSSDELNGGQYRASVRISTQKTYNGGLFIYDVVKMPVGMTTWPAIWSTAEDNWPDNGEIDMIEGVHESTQNQITMHTNATCTLPTGQLITGTVTNIDDNGSSNCDSTSNDDGCPTMDPTENGWGTNFNANGGGVFAKLWDPEVGIKIWHFPRGSVPSDITSQNPDPSSWGNPVSFLPNGDNCDVASHFIDHSLIINITLCGDWAGAVYSGSGTCLDATGDPSNYADAQWMLNSILVYQPS